MASEISFVRAISSLMESMVLSTLSMSLHSVSLRRAKCDLHIRMNVFESS